MDLKAKTFNDYALCDNHAKRIVNSLSILYRVELMND